MLDHIKRLAAVHAMRLSIHVVRDRMDPSRPGYRGASYEDIRCALLSAKHAIHQSDKDTWKVTGGRDTDGDSLDVVVVVEADVLVVTIF